MMENKGCASLMKVIILMAILGLMLVLINNAYACDPVKEYPTLHEKYDNCSSHSQPIWSPRN